MIMSTHIDDTIAVLITEIERRLIAARTAATAAGVAAQAGHRNEAVGTLLAIEEDLDSLRALYRAVIALHRAPAPQSPKSG